MGSDLNITKHLQDYINGVQATSHNSFKNGGVLKDDNYAYFVYDVFYDDLKSKEWNHFRKDSKNCF